MLYKIIDARSRQRSTALVTNIDFDAWGDYLGDAPLAMAFLDRVVDGAIIVKIKASPTGPHRAQPTATPGQSTPKTSPHCSPAVPRWAAGRPQLGILTLLDSSGNQSPGSLLVAKVAHFYA